MTLGRAMRWAGPAALAAALAAASGCGGGAPADPVVAEVGGVAVRLSALDRYLVQSLPDGEDAEPATADEQAQIKSRLLDDLLDEERLAAEAARRGITVAPDELRAYLRDAESASSFSPPPSPAPGRDADARRELLAQKIREDVARSVPAVGTDEAEAYLQTHRAELEAEGVPVDPSRADAALRQRAAERLAVERGEAANEHLLGELRGRYPAIVRKDRLPFPYRPASP